MGKIALLCVVLSIHFNVPVNAQECDILRVAGSDRWLPVSYVNEETQEPEGIAYDFAMLVGEQLKIPVEIHATLPWKRMLLYLEKGNIDMSVAMYKTKERQEVYQFTDSYLVNTARVFVKKGQEFPFERLEDLIGLTGGIPPGGSFGEKFDTFAKDHKLKLAAVATKEQRFLMLLNGRTDYYIQDYLDGTISLQQSGLQDKVVALPHPVSITKVYFSLSRQSPCVKLVPQINAIINKAKQDGALRAIIDKYVR